MITPFEIKQKAERLYPRFLSATVQGESFFPKDFPVGKLLSDYIALRDAVTQLSEQSKKNLGYGYTVELTTRNTRRYREQSLPTRILIETENDYLRLLKKEKEFATFKANINFIRSEVPQLGSWLEQNPFKVIEYADRWVELVKVCQYFQANPQPNLYIRELPIKVHTKFIEEHKGIIRYLLEFILPVEAIQLIFEKDHMFERQFSLRYNESLIRLRILDNALENRYCFPVSDLSVPVSEFKKLNLKAHHFIITENLMNFLTLPALADSFAMFVGGYGIQVLKSVSWLTHCPILYWGDLDADGFKILSQFRSYFPQTISVMMDEETFRTFKEFAVSAAGSKIENLSHLTPAEYCLFAYLSKHNKRLEQERISQDFANQYLQNLLQQGVQQC